MKKYLTLIMIVSLVSMVFTGCAAPETTAPETSVVTRGDLEIVVTVSGNLEMPHRADLSFGTTGTVAEVLVSEGDSVLKGQELARLDAKSLELNVEKAKARCEAAQIDYTVAENQLMQTIYPHYTNTYATDLPGVWIALDEAEHNLREAGRLLQQGETEEAQALLDSVGANLVKAQEKSQSRPWALPLSIKLLELKVEQAKTALDAAELDLASAELELTKTVITASLDGVVAAVSIIEGEQVSAATYASPAISLIDISKIEMDGTIDEIDISMVELGQEAQITLDAMPDKEVEGTLTYISPAGTVQAGVVSYQSTITLKKRDKKLRDGMSATAEIVVEHHDDVLLLPNRAIQGSLDNPTAEVVRGDQVEQRSIILGLSDGISTEVLSGLEEGDRVILPTLTQFPSSIFEM
jgi:RND family efflux transporter MFP subunit